MIRCMSKLDYEGGYQELGRRMNCTTFCIFDFGYQAHLSQGRYVLVRPTPSPKTGDSYNQRSRNYFVILASHLDLFSEKTSKVLV